VDTIRQKDNKVGFRFVLCCSFVVDVMMRSMMLCSGSIFRVQLMLMRHMVVPVLTSHRIRVSDWSDRSRIAGLGRETNLFFRADRYSLL
jgi:hypothetical protein